LPIKLLYLIIISILIAKLKLSSNKLFWFVGVYLLHTTCFSQVTDYGLTFNGQGFKLDDRTQLNLTKNNSLNFKNNFELEFDVRFNQKKQVYGYIFRIINDENNIDLLISNKPKTKDFLIVESNKESTLSPSSEKTNPIVQGKWYHIKINVSIPNNLLTVSVNDRILKTKTNFKSLKKLQFLFGANDYTGYITRDVPNMTLKDIKISENVLKYHFTLQQCGGNITKDRLKGVVGHVINGNWNLCKNSLWKKRFSTTTNGELLSTIDEQTGDVFLLSNKYLTRYKSNTIEFIQYDFIDKNYKLTLDHRIFYNQEDQKLYCYLVDTKQLAAFNFETKTWDNEDIFKNKKSLSLFQHHTSIKDEKNQTLYIIGGYGQYTYKNSVLRVDLNTRKWSQIDSITNVLKPRYLSGGAISNNNIYILGGYGSESGKQQINPKSYFELVKLDTNDILSNKVFSSPPLFNEMIVSNKVIIDETTNDFYALASEKSRFKGGLKLIKGNLNTSNLETFRDSIPYKFEDTYTYFDLYFDKKSKQLKASTSYLNDNKETEFSLYSINFPPANIFIASETEEILNQNYYIYVISLLVLFCLGFLIVKRLKINKKSTINKKETKIEFKKIVQKRDFQILFFGGFQIFDSKGIDITGMFSPLLKELFLLIYLYTYKDDKGISSGKLKEILWYDKNDRKAQNNRAVNTTKLKRILENVGELTISKKTGYWRIENNTTIQFNDYSFINTTILSNKPNKQDVIQLISIIKRGAFLNNLEYEWLDRFRQTVTDSIIDYLKDYVSTYRKEEDLNLLIEISQCLYNFDSVNEISLYLKCRVYNTKGNHKIVDETYKKFSAEYKLLYGQKFKYTLNDILSKDLDLLLY